MEFKQSNDRVQYLRYDTDTIDDAYDPWIAADQADTVASSSGIRISSNKDLTYIAMVSDRVVGALWSATYRDDDQDAIVYDFDVAVDKNYRWLSGLIGLKLIQYGIDDYRDLASDHERSYIRVWVINPKLVRVLQDRFGFEIESEHSDGSAHMVYYGS